MTEKRSDGGAKALGAALEAVAERLDRLETELAELRRMVEERPGDAPFFGVAPRRPSFPDPPIGRPPSCVGCAVEGCGRKHYSRGLCERHYQQWRRETVREAAAREEALKAAGRRKRRD